MKMEQINLEEAIELRFDTYQKATGFQRELITEFSTSMLKDMTH